MYNIYVYYTYYDMGRVIAWFAEKKRFVLLGIGPCWPTTLSFTQESIM